MTEAPPAVLAAVSDLFFVSKLRATAGALGVPLATVRSAEDVARHAAAGPPRLLLVDLNANGFDPFRLIRDVRALPGGGAVPVVGFFSHVQVELKERAEAAGATHVLPRSRFVERLPDILAGNAP